MRHDRDYSVQVFRIDLPPFLKITQLVPGVGTLKNSVCCIPTKQRRTSNTSHSNSPHAWPYPVLILNDIWYCLPNTNIVVLPCNPPAEPKPLCLNLELAGSPIKEEGWAAALSGETSKPYFVRLQTFLDTQYASKVIYPPREKLFNAFDSCPLGNVKVKGRPRLFTRSRRI